MVLIALYLAYTIFAPKGQVYEHDQLTMADIVNSSGGSAAEADDDLDGEEKLLKAIDQNDHLFDKELSGNLTKNGFTQLRNLITAMTQTEFKPKKEELMLQRIQAYKEQDWPTYGKMIGMAAQSFQMLMTERTKAVIEHLGYTEQTYGQMA